MAIGFQVCGPCLIRTDVDSDGTLASLGYTSNDDLPSYDEEIFNRPLTSTRHGDTIVDLVYRGRTALLSFVLVEWEEDIVESIQEEWPGASVASELGQVGLRWRAEGAGETDYSFQVEIVPAIVGQFSYLFHHCIPNGAGGFRMFDFGNQEKQIGLQFIVLPDLNTNIVDADSVFFTRTLIT